MKKEAGKKLIEQTVENFEKNVAVLKKKGHGETNIRSNYIDVLFEALGWNMKSHYDVVREFSQKDSSGTKKVDYAFKINGKLKFFVEAKEASIDLVNDKSSIYQAKRYAYSTNGKAPIVILTDFEEFRVFNVLKAPDFNNTDRELLKKHCFEYTGYIENWDFLWDTFSKDAVAAGSIEALRGKIDKNTKTMDVDFLEQITGWRETLAKTIALRNKELAVDELNEAVQRILDRLLFVRNLEDREIEPENTLLDKTKKAENIYKSLIPVFNSLDNVYNGLLFKKHFSEELVIDDKTIKDIIKSMCYPVSPFQFDVIEPEILGRIYEKFLGSKIRLTENHQAKIEEKMEVRKAGGVYYTPEYIVNYIVENTVGKKIEGLNPEEIKKIKIVDPACGSGSFLLGAYSYLLDYHEKWYAANKSDKAYKKDYYISKDGELKVNLDKRGAILRDNIFGVDIDKEATEVAIMSLYLKMLDDGFDKGERDLFFIKGHVLPDMTDNVKCGNSLIGTDYFDGKLEIDIEEMKEIKAFDWEKEFPSIFKSDGGFDCVIGNPPYIRSDSLGNYKNYYQSKYSVYDKTADIFFYFYEKSFKLLRKNGIYGVISNNFNKTTAGRILRKYLKEQTKINQIIDFSKVQIFKGAVTYPIIFIAENDVNVDNTFCYHLVDNENDFIEKKNIIQFVAITQSSLDIDTWSFNDKSSKIISKIITSKTVRETFGKCYYGVKTSLNEAFILDNSELPFSENVKIIFEGKDIKKWITPDINKKLILFQSGFTKTKYSISSENALYKKIESDFPEIFKIIKPFEQQAKKRYDQGDYWWELRSCAYYDLFEKPKIIFPNLQNTNKFSLDDKGYYINAPAVFLPVDDKWLLGILNSKLVWFFLLHICVVRSGGYIEVKPQYFEQIPIPEINEKEQNELIALVDQMLQAKKDCRSCKSESDKKLYEQKIGMLDKKIDDLVYKLYGLTDEEIAIVEG